MGPVSGHGPAWVNEVLELDLIHDKRLEEARKFVQEAILNGGVKREVSSAPAVLLGEPVIPEE